MKIKTYIIDAFTNEPFRGNPAGVCLLEKPIDESLMQAIASEINLSETAFLIQDSANPSEFSIRYFTPKVEIAFCGHATLASSKVALSKLGLSKVSFTTHHQLKLSAELEGNFVAMKFPLYPTVEHNPIPGLNEALGISHPLSIRHASELKMMLIEVKDNETLLALKPDFAKVLAATDNLNLLIVTARSTDAAYDFYSRCYCPWIGINEDPVTGAAHTVLAKYWGDKLGKTEMRAYQSSKRGGFMNLRIINAAELEVKSNAQIVLEGFLEV